MYHIGSFNFQLDYASALKSKELRSGKLCRGWLWGKTISACCPGSILCSKLVSRIPPEKPQKGHIVQLLLWTFSCLITPGITLHAALGASAVCLWCLFCPLCLLHWGWQSQCSHKCGWIFFSARIGTGCLDGHWLMAAELCVLNKPANCNAFSKVHRDGSRCPFEIVLGGKINVVCLTLTCSSGSNPVLVQGLFQWVFWKQKTPLRNMGDFWLPGNVPASQQHSFHPSAPPAPQGRRDLR